MIYIVHPLVRKIGEEYKILRSLIDYIPQFYQQQVDELEQMAKEDAEGAADGDCDIYSTVYHQYDSTIELASETPNQSRSYMVAAVYAFYERNVKEVYKALNVQSRKVYPEKAFHYCGVNKQDYQILFDRIDLTRQIRDNISHGVLNDPREWELFKKKVAMTQGIEMIDDVVIITDNNILDVSLESVRRFFKVVIAAHQQFAPKRIEGER